MKEENPIPPAPFPAVRRRGGRTRWIRGGGRNGMRPSVGGTRSVGSSLKSPLRTAGRGFRGGVCALLLLCAFLQTALAKSGEHPLVLSPAPTVWDEALPLGNGLLGALVWGEGQPLNISLDRTDLWDLRPVPEFDTDEYNYGLMRRWVQEGRIEDLHRLYDDPYHRAGPTKIPAGRIELLLGSDTKCTTGTLFLDRALASMDLGESATGQVFVHAKKPVGLIRLQGVGAVEPRLVAPPFGGQAEAPGKPAISAGDLALLGYDPPMEASGENWVAFLQKGWEGFQFAVALEWKKSGDVWLGAWSIATSKESRNATALAREQAHKALHAGWEEELAQHESWWEGYWSRSSIELPNATLERQWYLEMYKFGSAAREDTPPISLQGPWTADNGQLPPWKGDYHHDLNTELSYWPCYSGNRLDLGVGFVNWLWDTQGNCEGWTKRFFGLPGTNVPMTSDLLNRQIGGWHQYTHSSTTGCWLAHHFYLHWRYSMDRKFLEDKAEPYLHAVATFIEAVTEKGEDGKRFLPLSSSPEIHDNRLEAWFPSTTNYDLALMRWALEKSAELSREVGLEEDAGNFETVLSEMPELATSEEDGRLTLAAGTPLHESHRHFSHLMAIHPLGLVQWEKGEADQRIIRGALAELDRLGSRLWTGYSFAWSANLAARAKEGKKAEEALEIFSKAFCLRNSFHCNGDQSGKGYSSMTYRPFTLEGNFAAAAGIQEMLIQSYSGTIHLFPAIPVDWNQCAFHDLRAEGAFVISAKRKEGRVVKVLISAETGGTCRLRNPFGDEEFEAEGIDREQVVTEGDTLILETTKGQKVVLKPI